MSNGLSGYSPADRVDAQVEGGLEANLKANCVVYYLPKVSRFCMWTACDMPDLQRKMSEQRQREKCARKGDLRKSG